jgi:hypothetical protein
MHRTDRAILIMSVIYAVTVTLALIHLWPL